MNKTAKCLSGYEWSFSSINQSPCEVAAGLAGICVGTRFDLAPLDSGVVYSGPSPDSADSCKCSSVYYALLSACAYCQTRRYIRWSAYITNCSTPYLQRFVEPIPRGINVPPWAYQDVSADDIFNVTLAQINATNTHNSPPTSTSQPDSSNSLNVAAIAGGLVGGFLLIGLIIGFITFYLTRRHSRSSRRGKRATETQAQDLPLIPGFSSSALVLPHASAVSSQTNYMDNPQVYPPELPSRRVVPFPVSTDRHPNPNTQPPRSQSLSLHDYLMTKADPYTVASPSTPNVPYNLQDSKQPLLARPPSNFSAPSLNGSETIFNTNTNTNSQSSALALHHLPLPSSSSSSSSYQQQQRLPLPIPPLLPPHHQRPLTFMSPLITGGEQLPAYSEVIGPVAAEPTSSSSAAAAAAARVAPVPVLALEKG